MKRNNKPKPALRFSQAGQDYVIQFQYGLSNQAWVQSCVMNDRVGMNLNVYNVTTCVIIHGPTGTSTKKMKLLISGQALRACTDQFNKETGRKQALTKLLSGFEKGFRTMVWKVYFDRLPKGDKA